MQISKTMPLERLSSILWDIPTILKEKNILTRRRVVKELIISDEDTTDMNFCIPFALLNLVEKDVRMYVSRQSTPRGQRGVHIVASPSSASDGAPVRKVKTLTISGLPSLKFTA